MSHLRPATGADRAALAAFRCARPSASFEREVEEFFGDALTWRDHPEGDGRDVLVLDEDGEITAAVAYEDDDDDIFVNALAVRSDCQGAGRGTQVLLSTLADLTERRSPSVVTWLVHPANFASHAMSEAVGAEATYPAEDRPYARFAIQI